MALTEKNVCQIEVTENDHVQVRVKRIIIDNGEEISSSFHRYVISPGQDYASETGKVRRMCQNAHVPTVVDRYQAGQARIFAEQARDNAKNEREADDTPENEAAEEAAEQALLDAEALAEAAEAAHEAFLIAEDQ